MKEKEDGRQLSLGSKSSGKELFAYLEEVLPDYSKESVYASDVKKLVSWYNLLVEKNIDLDEVETTDEVTDEVPATEEEEK